MSKEGVLVVGHGSRLDFNKETILMQAENLKGKGYDLVEVGFNETSEPTIEEALSNLVAKGADTIYAVPLFIASGVHITRDIPGKLGIEYPVNEGETVVDDKRVFVKYCDPIGRDPMIADILASQIESKRA